MYFKILEKGNDYAVYSLKGMELQETSCHNLEATRVDDIFNKTFDQVLFLYEDIDLFHQIFLNLILVTQSFMLHVFIQFQRSWFNRYSLHTLTPLTQIETRMYSSSSSSLTG